MFVQILYNFLAKFVHCIECLPCKFVNIMLGNRLGRAFLIV